MSHPETVSKIDSIIEDVARVLGYMVYKSSVFLKGNNSRIIVKIDHLKGISHSDCESFSKELARKLDEENILPNYSLEVSSPGLSRSIRDISEFERFIGSPVKAVCRKDGREIVYKGVIKKVIDSSIELNVDDKIVTILYGDIKKANLDFF